MTRSTTPRGDRSIAGLRWMGLACALVMGACGPSVGRGGTRSSSTGLQDQTGATQAGEGDGWVTLYTSSVSVSASAESSGTGGHGGTTEAMDTDHADDTTDAAGTTEGSSTSAGSSESGTPPVDCDDSRLVFVTSMVIDATMTQSEIPLCDNPMGTPIDRARCICDWLENPMSVGWMEAWLSTAESSAADRIAPDPGEDRPYCLPSGILVADDWDHLTDPDTPLHHPIDEDEQGNPLKVIPGSTVWTGTDPTAMHIPGFDCVGWTTAGDIDGARGRTDAVDEAWTQDPVPAMEGCYGMARLYCFEKL